MNVSFLSSPEYAAIALAFYLHLAHIVSYLVTRPVKRSMQGEKTGKNLTASIIFYALTLIGALVAFTSFIEREGCTNNFLTGQAANSGLCVQGALLVGKTILKIVQYAPIFFVVAGALFLIRCAIARLKKDSYGDLFVIGLLHLSLAMLFYSFAHSPAPLPTGVYPPPQFLESH